MPFPRYPHILSFDPSKLYLEKDYDKFILFKAYMFHKLTLWFFLGLFAVWEKTIFKPTEEIHNCSFHVSLPVDGVCRWWWKCNPLHGFPNIILCLLVILALPRKYTFAFIGRESFFLFEVLWGCSSSPLGICVQSLFICLFYAPSATLVCHTAFNKWWGNSIQDFFQIQYFMCKSCISILLSIMKNFGDFAWALSTA